MSDFKRVWVTGDTHGDFDFLYWFCEANKTSAESDMLIVLGDAGINYFPHEYSGCRCIKKNIENCNITLFCVRGNHEERPQNRIEYKLQDVGIGDYVYVEDDYPHIWFAQDGGEYNIGGMSFLTIGGAYSVDKEVRLLRGWNWFADEMLDEYERKAILDKISGKSYDHVLTHTCPYEWQPSYLFLGSYHDKDIPKDMEWFLSAVKNEITYGHWWFGHYHDDIRGIGGDPLATMLFHEKVRIK